MSIQDYILILRAMTTELHDLEINAKTEEERNIYWARRKFCALEYERVSGIFPDYEIEYPNGFIKALLRTRDKLSH